MGIEATSSVPWDMVAAISALAGLLILLGWQIIYQSILKPRLEVRKARKPCEIHFLIPEQHKRILSYASQDDKEHLVDELTLPSNSLVTIELWIKPKMNFHESEFYFGCEGDDVTKPRPIEYDNRFVERGLASKASPETDRNHYVDHHAYYHVRTERDLISSEVYVRGFSLKTIAEGKYTARVFFHTSKVLGRADISIRVEDQPTTEMRCAIHKSCFIKPMRQTNGNNVV